MNPDFVVATASDRRIRYCGDGEWFAECPVSGCSWWSAAFCAGSATAAVDTHQRDRHQ